MKKVLIIALVVFVSIGTISTVKSFSIQSVTELKADWKKSKEGTWPGKKGMWYKLNTTDASLWVSTDGKEWKKSDDGLWQDKDGKWLKVHEGKLVWSADGGKTWSEVPEWKWMGEDGAWYKFDSTWGLWVAK